MTGFSTNTGTITGPTLARPRALATTHAWPVTSAVRVSSNQYSDLARCAAHNSMITPDVVTGVVTLVPAGRDGLGAAKQAAPPRGVPR